MSVRANWVVIVLILALPVLAEAQDRATLEKERQKLEQQIKETNSLLKQSEKERKASVANLQMLKSEIAMREGVVRSLRQELDMMNSEIKGHERSHASLSATMDQLRKAQAKQIRNAYLERQMSHPILFILSAENLNEAFLRWQYRNRILHARKRTLQELKNTATAIRQELASLESLKSQKQDITTDMQAQESELKRSASSAQDMVSKLEKKERSLKNQLEKQQKQSKQLASEIERVIAAEIKKSTSKTNLPAAPEMTALATEFARNKGKLPWPVDQGLITSRFGTQPHPVVKSITISNNGIDITAPPGSPVRCIFGGKVVGRKFIPGFDNMVIIQHGSYYSVYSRLAEVQVDLNQEVEARKTIGRLSTSGDENPRLHLEIWENKSQLDPEKWISR